MPSMLLSLPPILSSLRGGLAALLILAGAAGVLAGTLAPWATFKLFHNVEINLPGLVFLWGGLCLSVASLVFLGMRRSPLLCLLGACAVLFSLGKARTEIPEGIRRQIVGAQGALVPVNRLLDQFHINSANGTWPIEVATFQGPAGRSDRGRGNVGERWGAGSASGKRPGPAGRPRPGCGYTPGTARARCRACGGALDAVARGEALPRLRRLHPARARPRVPPLAGPSPSEATATALPAGRPCLLSPSGLDGRRGRRSRVDGLRRGRLGGGQAALIERGRRDPPHPVALAVHPRLPRLWVDPGCTRPRAGRTQPPPNSPKAAATSQSGCATFARRPWTGTPSPGWRRCCAARPRTRRPGRRGSVATVQTRLLPYWSAGVSRVVQAAPSHAFSLSCEAAYRRAPRPTARSPNPPSTSATFSQLRPWSDERTTAPPFFP